ncbi:MAG: hypothetical protein J6Y97_04810 [Prevotella sp.]|nr:hypothetical protein [Prevotella sp.]
MKHTCLLLIGDDFSEVAKGIYKYVLKYGKGEMHDYLSVMQVRENGNDFEILVAERAKPDEGVFSSDIDSAYQVTMKPQKSIPGNLKNFVDEAGVFLADFFHKRVTLNKPGDGRITLCIILSPTCPIGIQLVEDISIAVSQNQLKYDIDIILYPHNGKVTYEDSPQSVALDIEKTRTATLNVVDILLSLRKKFPSSLRLITLLQDKNQKGVTITFSLANLIRILGEYGMICTEDFNAVFPSAVLLNNKDNLCTFGISQLSMDSNYVIQYLLRQAFIRLLEKEQADQKDIDVNKVGAVAIECLHRHHQLQSEFYDKYIAPVIAEGKSEQDAITSSGDKLNQFMKQVESDLLSFMDSHDLTLPEKRCVIALILGEDDDLLVGDLFDKDQMTLLDYYSETVNLFVDNNNKNLHPRYDEDGKTMTDDFGHTLMEGGAISKSVDELGYCRFYLDELKRLRLAIRQSTAYIRKKEDELAQLDVSQQHEEESNKVVSTDGFVFGGKTYKFIPDEPAKPVNETYVPKPVKTDNINLSGHFPPVRSQGSIGSCSPHSIVAIYEYILKKNKKAECDLSERYVYYNARRAKGCIDKDDGASLYDVIKTMEKEGVCLESLCPYDDELMNIEPTGEAYDDGRQRLIMKSMNIPIGDSTEKNIEALRSALSEGYPIAVGLRLFDSFASTNGFVLLPTEEEIASEEHHHHAMVVCGYDDKQKYFLVRNSWGTKFGKDGYCYIPYAYLGDNRLIHGAYIVTEVSPEGIQVEGVVGTERFSFNAADNDIKAAVIQNMIVEERNKLQRLKKEYHDLRYMTEELLQQLATANTRDEILDESKSRLQREITKAKERQDKLTGERGEHLHEHEKTTSSWILKLAGIALGLLLINGVWTYNFWSDEPLNIGTHTWVLLGMLIICLMTILSYYIERLYSYKHLREDIDELINREGMKISKLEKELESLKRKFHIGGMMMDRLSALDHNLNEFYKSAKSFVYNLSHWLGEEREKSEKMTPMLLAPFDTIIDNNTLDEYFEKNIDNILREQYLYQFLCDGTYKLGTDQIIAFQKKLQRHILDCLSKDIENFRIHDYVMEYQQYPFLPPFDSGIVDDKLKLMESYSMPFCQMVNPKKSAVSLFIQRNGETGNNGPWQSVLSERPSVLNTSTPWSLTIIKTTFASKDEISLLS